MFSLLLAAQLVTATPAPGVDCSLLTPQQAQGLNCIPPKPAPAPPPPPAPTGQQAPLVLQFQVGHTYRRPATGVVLHIAALGASKAGFAVYAAECLNEVSAEQCWYPGAGRFILGNASASGWEEVP